MDGVPSSERAVRRGHLTVYLGAAPGVGKTFAMLDEARRRQARGTDVVVGYVETHGRTHTIAKLAGLEVLARRELDYRGTRQTEMDLDAVLARAPRVALVDELAHTNVPGSRHPRRAADVLELLDAGIDVITTVNIQHLESLNGEVERITGIRQRETVPDDLVRRADQIQLVDMSPHALRRRLAHGNIYRAEQVDASLSSYFREGNLTALRELALLWLADRVDDALGDYRRKHRIEQPWPVRERVVVAVTGGPESETLLRRGARIADRAAGSELHGVSVLRSDGLGRVGDRRLDECRRLVESLGGSFHTVVGEDVARAVVDFATGINASMVVAGVSRASGARRLLVPSTASEIARLSGDVDVHLVTHDEVSAPLGRRRQRSTLSRRRRSAGWALAVLLPAVLTLALPRSADAHALPAQVMAYLAVSVLAAVVGGLLPGLLAALSSFLQLNWFFTPPVGRLTVAEPANLLALLVFLLVSAGVAMVVDTATRRSRDAARARAEAGTLAALSRSVLTGEDTAEAVVHRLQESFAFTRVSLLRGSTRTGWSLVASDPGTAGDPLVSPEQAEDRVRVDDDHLLVMSGGHLEAGDRRILEGFAAQTGLVLEYRRLREHEARAQLLETAEATSTAVLRAVSHDLRTPLATARTAVDGLRLGGLEGPERDELLAAIDTSTATLEHLIDNLLDLSRLSSGLVRPQLREVSLDEVLPVAVAGHGGSVDLELDESEPLVRTDPGLLERVVANVVDNAVRHRGRGAHPETPVRVTAHAGSDEVEIRVVDRGPGLDEEAKAHMFDPFQRLGDHGAGGLGLGLAVAHGLTTAVEGQISAEDTPGGGLTVLIRIPRADPEVSR